MNESSLGYVCQCVESEGFDYAFAHYSDFSEVKNEEFQRLKSELLDARKKLAEFLGVEDEL